jgi:hypothetical protein
VYCGRTKAALAHGRCRARVLSHESHSTSLAERHTKRGQAMTEEERERLAASFDVHVGIDMRKSFHKLADFIARNMRRCSRATEASARRPSARWRESSSPCSSPSRSPANRSTGPAGPGIVGVLEFGHPRNATLNNVRPHSSLANDTPAEYARTATGGHFIPSRSRWSCPRFLVRAASAFRT